MTVVAISAAYGTRSGQIGPKLAERLGVPFVDRAIALRVAEVGGRLKLDSRAQPGAHLEIEIPAA